MIDYVYLESGERRKYAQLGHEYLIEQVQFSGTETVNLNASSTSNNQKFKLNYNHPTKELVWAMRVGAFNGEANSSSFSGGRGRFLTYTHDDSAWNSTALDDAARNLAEGCVFVNPDLTGLTANINGQSAHLCNNVDNPGYNNGHRVVVDLRNNDVTGDLSNMDLVNVEGIVVYCYDTLFSSVDFSLLGNNNGVELSDMLDHARVVVSHTAGNPNSISVECHEVRHRLTLTDLSVPVEDFAVDYRSADSRRFCVHTDVTVTQPHNYGLRLDGVGNPVHSANLQLNGHDRFKMQEGSYFNYYQTCNHHTRTPADGVNVYSFALHPEKHQPSGTTNLSRIDSAILNLNFSDGLRQNNRLKLDIARDTMLYIFAFSYNVLRVMSGMAGLAYSN
jgi:hypothetical protein